MGERLTATEFVECPNGLTIPRVVATGARTVVVGITEAWVEIETGSGGFTVIARTSKDGEKGHDGIAMFTMTASGEVRVDAGARYLAQLQEGAS